MNTEKRKLGYFSHRLLSIVVIALFVIANCQTAPSTLQIDYITGYPAVDGTEDDQDRIEIWINDFSPAYYRNVNCGEESF